VHDYYPPPLPVPTDLRSTRLTLRMLSAEDVDLDLDAVEASRAQLLRRSGGRWPRLGFHWRDNLSDLVGHQIEHLQRRAFTYTVMAPDGRRCLGCLYLRPLGEQLDRLGAPPDLLAGTAPRSTTATFWLRPDALAIGLDRHLLTLLRSWFRQAWSFSDALLLTNDAEVRVRRLAETTNLPTILELKGEGAGAGKVGGWKLYRL
jgi:hypothetical protein